MVVPLDPVEVIHWHRREIQPPLLQIPWPSTSDSNSLDLCNRSVIFREVDSEVQQASGRGTVSFGGGFWWRRGAKAEKVKFPNLGGEGDWRRHGRTQIADRDGEWG